MSAPVLEAVPNFSEGRDSGLVRALADAMSGAGAEVLDASADPDHHRCVITIAGPPVAVESAVVAATSLAVERIDLRVHRGVHPRIGAADVLPFVPLAGLGMDAARASARRVARRLVEEVGIPVFLYAESSDPPGRRLAEIRRGGFEAMVEGWPPDRAPDLLPERWPHSGAHPTAGAACVGARPLLLAWNAILEGFGFDQAREVAESIRESGGGFAGLRALAFELPSTRRLQLSMNLEDVGARAPFEIFRRIEELVAERGGYIEEVEVIGMLPDELALPAAADRLRLRSPSLDRSLSRRMAAHLAARHSPPQPRDG